MKDMRGHLLVRFCEIRLREYRLELFVGTFEVGDFVIALKVPDSGCDLVDQIVIVRGDQYCPWVALQRDVQRVDRLQIEMVRRFVQH